jgi:hypothetical protein
MKTRALWVMTLWIAGLGFLSATSSCEKAEPNPPAVSPAAKAAADKAAADKMVADKTVADKAVADKAVADLLASQKAAADKAAAVEADARNSAAEKVVADAAAAKKVTAQIAAAEEAAAAKAVSDKTAADKAAADKAAAQAKAEAATLPADLVLMKAEVTRALSQIDVTMAKLQSLSIATGDLKKPSQGALESIQSLDTQTQDIKKRADDMRNRGAAYFEAWEKQLAAMSSPEVMAIAAKRKDELAAKYTEVLTAMQESRAAFDPYWADLTAIRKAIEDGLTPETLKALAPKVKEAREKATTLMTRVEVASAKLDQVGVIYTKPDRP